nr:Chain P, mupain-1-16-IG [synthetic construct]
CPAYSAYIGC